MIRAEEAQSAPAISYFGVLRQRSVPPLLGASLMTRTAMAVWSVALILFALQRFHSPALAGLSLFAYIFPGLVLSPIGGALIDRFGRKRLMVLDFAIAAASLFVIVGLSLAGQLPAWLLLTILVLSSLTGTLGMAGTRSIVPLTVPAEMWDRANALDSFTSGIAQVVGPAIAGLLTAWRGGEAALAAAGIGFLAGVLCMLAVREPHVEKQLSGNVMHDAWLGLRYVLSHRTLRGIAISSAAQGVGWGLVEVALPVLVFRLGGGPALVGELFAAAGLVGVPAALLAGRLETRGREREIMALGSILLAVSVFMLLVPSVAVILAAMLLLGISEGPSNLAMFSLRQRRTSTAWFGRAFAVSMALNFGGVPLGSALAGPVIKWSLAGTIVVGGILSLAAAVLIMVAVPKEEDSVRA